MRVPILVQPPTPWYLRAALLFDVRTWAAVGETKHRRNDYLRAYTDPKPGSVGRGLARAMERGCHISERTRCLRAGLMLPGRYAPRDRVSTTIYATGLLSGGHHAGGLSPFFLSFLDTS